MQRWGIFFYVMIFLLCASCLDARKRIKMPGVLFSASKDIPILNVAVRSVIEHLDLSILYVVVPGENFEGVKFAFASNIPFQRVKVINEDWLSIPIKKNEVRSIMLNCIREKGIYGELSTFVKIK